jgi:filamentous hemagglutinin
VLYHETSNTLVIRNAEGVPSTMYRPNSATHGYATNIDYFNNHSF